MRFLAIVQLRTGHNCPGGQTGNDEHMSVFVRLRLCIGTMALVAFGTFAPDVACIVLIILNE
jgi:hypothetical protein